MPFSQRPTAHLLIESQILTTLGGGGFPGPPSQVLPAVLPSLSFGGWGGGATRPSLPGPSSSPSQLVLWGGGGTQALLTRSFQQSFPAGPSGGGGHVTYPIMYLMLPVCSWCGLMQLLMYYWDPPPPPQSLTD